MKKFFTILLFVALLSISAVAQNDAKAEEVFKKAVTYMGGDAYLKVRTQIGRGKLSVMQNGMSASFQSFTDAIVFPDKERTDFKEFGRKTIQVNVGDAGWIWDEKLDIFSDQSPKQIADFKRAMMINLDSFLRGTWRGKATLTHAGRREASLGKRNDVLKLSYEEGLVIEFEISAEGVPMKSVYKQTNPDGVEATEEDRFAQWVDVQGIKFPFIVDHFSGKVHSTRINYETVDLNKTIPDSIFVKPATTKELKKDMKL